jgi:DNA polymerase III epsilon subunit family exonuclease
MSSRFAVIDFETTGLSPDNGDRITEVAIVIVESGKVVDQFESLVNTGRSIPYEVQSLTGITNQMTANAPLASLIITQVHEYVKNSTLVAHNASFDSKFFHSEMSKVGLRTNVDFICTLLLSRRLYPTLENHKLGTLAKHHGIKSQGKSHRALADALVTAELFIKISKDLKDHLSTVNLTAHHYLHSQKQPLSSFLKPSRPTNTPSIKPQLAAIKPLIKQAPQQTTQTKPINNATDVHSINAAITRSTVDTASKRINSHLQHHEIVSWIKTSTGLKNKKTGLLIPFADTLRDAFPVPGYQVKGSHPFGFIKDSEIDNPQPTDNEKSSQIIPQAMQKLRNFLKSDAPDTKSQNQSNPKTTDASSPKDGFGQKSFSNGDHYEGIFSNGKFHGHGLYTWKDGASFEGNWINGEITGIGKKVFVDGSTQSGNFLNGKLHGYGTQIFSPTGEWKGDNYVGEFVNGIREGLGTYTWSNGTTYSGQWLAGKMFGNGTKKIINGTIDTGNFKDGLLDGFGARTWKSNETPGEDRYEGHFQNGLRHGRGIQTFANGDRYDGDWVKDIRDGNGTYTWPSGNQYKGGWVNGRMAGQGLLTWVDGGSHEGMFANGLRHGKGAYKTANGEEYSGIWLAGELDQECKYSDVEDNAYEGGLKAFQFHGHGTLTWSTGEKYEGGFVDGLRQGKGTFTTKSNAKHSGQWKAGILVDAYDEWIEKQAAKFSSRYKKLINLRQICDAHSAKWKGLDSILKENSNLKEEYEQACQSLAEKLDVLLADYDAFNEEFFIDISKCYFCCCEEDYEDEILYRFEKRIEHITTLRDELYEKYLGLI